MNARDQEIDSSIAASIDNAETLWKTYYLLLAKILLKKQLYVSGDDIKAFCTARGLWKPDTHNRWVGMPTVLETNGWLTPLVKVKPHRTHNHMPEVTFYRSNLFDENEQWKLI